MVLHLGKETSKAELNINTNKAKVLRLAGHRNLPSRTSRALINVYIWKVLFLLMAASSLVSLGVLTTLETTSLNTNIMLLYGGSIWKIMLLVESSKFPTIHIYELPLKYFGLRQ